MNDAMQNPWWKGDKGDVNKQLVQYVSAVESAHFDRYDRFLKLQVLYDPNTPWAGGDTGGDKASRDKGDRISENVIASNVDTVTAAIAAYEVRARFPTDGAGWTMQRLAKDLEKYSEELCDTYDVDSKCKAAFSCGSAVKGTGLIYADLNTNDEIVCELVPPDDVVVDDRECRGGRAPKQIHWRRFRDRDELIAEYPHAAEEIRNAQRDLLMGETTRWADYRPVEDNEIVTITSWRVPVGKKGTKGYQAGRRVTVIDGFDLEDEVFEDEFPPFAKIVWTPREDSFFGIGLAERIAGHQRMVNRSNLQIERILDQNAFVTTYVDMADANLAHKTINRVGTVVPHKGARPQAVAPPAVHPEHYARHERTVDKSYEESGVSRMAARSVKPAGLDSGRALREYRDQTTQRFAMQEQAYEKFKLAVVLLLLRACKKLAAKGKKPPTIVKETMFGPRKIPWSKVEPAFLKATIAAASNLNRTPAGREQTLIEWAQAGVISMDDFRRMIGHPDLERAMSLYTAAQEDVDAALEEIAEGHVVMPEPFMNLEMAIWRGQQQYILWRRIPGVPESVLEGVRQFVVQAAAVLDMREMEAQGVAGAAGPDASAGPAEPIPGPAPSSGPGAAAFSDQAMQVMSR